MKILSWKMNCWCTWKAMWLTMVRSLHGFLIIKIYLRKQNQISLIKFSKSDSPCSVWLSVKHHLLNLSQSSPGFQKAQWRILHTQTEVITLFRILTRNGNFRRAIQNFLRSVFIFPQIKKIKGDRKNTYSLPYHQQYKNMHQKLMTSMREKTAAFSCRDWPPFSRLVASQHLSVCIKIVIENQECERKVNFRKKNVEKLRQHGK